ncbi:MAG: hypothetical protein H6R07_1052 [Proteobacteria bacterium]|nr:hypothetical protein [Pseudomonadota bacterium]
MHPRDLLQKNLEPRVIHFFNSHGFRFSSRKLEFNRTIGSTKQTVGISLSKWNKENDCTFWSMWGASSKDYAKWHEEQWGISPTSNALGGVSDWNITEWKRGPDKHFQLSGKPEDADEMNEFLVCVERAGFPYLDKISSWVGAAEQLVAERWMFDRAADFLLIAGDHTRAKEVLLEGVRTFTVDLRHDNFNELPRVKQRLQRYFGESIA